MSTIQHSGYILTNGSMLVNLWSLPLTLSKCFFYLEENTKGGIERQVPGSLRVFEEVYRLQVGTMTVLEGSGLS